MKKLLWLLLPLYVSAQKNIPASLDAYFKEHSDFSGVVLIADKGQPVYYKSFGYREFASKTPLEKTDIFELASVSKQFTAMIIMMLQEKGLLQYEDKVEKYLNVPYKGITIRQLLTHTSGLPDYQAVMDQYWDKSKMAGNPDIIAYLNKYAPPARFEPGTQYEYSNTGYVLLASIAEKASGKDFIEMCRSWIFQPLKMTHTDIRTLKDKAAVKNFAIGHIWVKEKNDFIRADSFPSTNYIFWLGNRKGPGRISSTAEDLLKWDQALYTNRLVASTTLEEAFSSMRLKDGSFSHYGFGWELPDNTYNGRIVKHDGDNPGYKTMIVRNIGRNKTILVLCNNAVTYFPKMIESLEKICWETK